MQRTLRHILLQPAGLPGFTISLKPVMLLLACLGITLQPGMAQKLDHRQGEFIIQWKDGVQPEDALIKVDAKRHNWRIESMNPLANAPSWSLLKVNTENAKESEVLDALRSNPAIQLAQFNHILHKRNATPNDPRFGDQWYLNGDFGINAQDAWMVATGGKTALQDDIVMAVIDDGISFMHPDLVQNLWTNNQEIPNNQLDDDGNGYVDDYHGWNILKKNGQVDGGEHGVFISGLMAASGNNNVGIAGLNWSGKVMMIQHDLIEILESEILEGYAYILAQRKRYEATEGKEGAFVVATNASFGIDDKFPEDAPIWCAFYDTLGAYGILNVGATTNFKTNIDVMGDLPTTCPSPFLITVTTSKKDGNLGDAGFGVENIDLAAPGVDMLSTAGKDSYFLGDGTSYAAPLVTGSIGLLYSAPCLNLAILAHSFPAMAAMRIRNALLENVNKNANWETLIASSGLLDIGKSMNSVMAECVSICSYPTNVDIQSRDSTGLEVRWDTPTDDIVSVALRWKALSDTTWHEINPVNSPYLIANLQGCTDYEIQFSTVCATDTLLQDYTESILARTAGCCEPPGGMEVVDIMDTTATVQWNPVLSAQGYNIRIRPMGSTIDWTTYGAGDTSFFLQNLKPCTFYEVQVRVNCETGNSVYSTSRPFKTFGCGGCNVNDYCPSRSMDASNEWIEEIKVGSIDNISGSNDGYGNFTIYDTIGTDLAINSKYRITLTPGFKDKKFKVFWRVWIDYNYDRDFDDPGELVLQNEERSDTVFSGVILIPPVDSLANTVMRVSMRTVLSDVLYPEPCDTLDFGEVEDYCVQIAPSKGICQEIFEFDSLAVGSSSVEMYWDTVQGGLAYLLRYKAIDDEDFGDWQFVADDTTYKITDLKACTEYIIQVQSVCEFDTSGYFEQHIFTTGNNCMTSRPVFDLVQNVRLYPNPSAFIDPTLTFRMEEREQVQLQVFNMQGQVIYQKLLGNLAPGDYQEQLPIANAVKGMYLIRLQTSLGGITKKWIKL